MSSDSARITTRGKAAAVPAQWIPHTHAEISENQRKCAEEKDHQQEVTTQKKQAKKEKQQQAKKKVAEQEDANALEDKEIQSLRPDLDMIKKGLPPSLQAPKAKPSRKRTQPVNVLPRAVTPVILSPAGGFAEIPASEVGLDSLDELPPISSVATSESKGISDERMDLDFTSGNESPPMGTEMVIDDSGSDGEYVEPSTVVVSDTGSDDEQDEAVLYQEFLAARRHRAKASALKPKQALSKPDRSLTVAPKAKGQPKIKTVNSKLEVRQAITSLRTVAPTSTTPGPASTKKRPTKRSKSDSIRGLVANWEKMYQQSAPTTSTTSLASSAQGGETEADPPGEFDHDEDVDAIKEARKAKDQIKTQNDRNHVVATGKGPKVNKHCQKSVTVKLELANVNEIDGKEREKVKTRKAAWKFEDLPLPSTADIKLFKTNVIVPILDWAATLEDQFSTNSHSELKPTVQIQIRTHRSELGKAAMAAISRNWKHPELKGCKTAEQRAEWVQNASKNKWFVYDKPENTAAEGRRAYLGGLLVQTIAYHIQRTISTPTTFGPPAGALALAAAAVWKKGVNSLTGKQSKNTPDSFGEDPWVTVVKQHYKNTSILSKDKWNEIYLRCREFSAGGKGDDGEDTDNEEDNESEDGIGGHRIHRPMVPIWVARLLMKGIGDEEDSGAVRVRGEVGLVVCTFCWGGGVIGGGGVGGTHRCVDEVDGAAIWPVSVTVRLDLKGRSYKDRTLSQNQTESNRIESTLIGLSTKNRKDGSRKVYEKMGERKQETEGDCQVCELVIIHGVGEQVPERRPGAVRQEGLSFDHGYRPHIDL
ncbi:hypothetical protein EV421DRAFT_1736829 [Armillaria borealis]|uniref:Uncharacterized protein n=1 Tax=Armillaria borealis TaxID=47425 RepID=A0AA39JGJ6_9AGAR|nr:hypothetical protein EV421DRAFT_1736829 [Armillaria borealis]